MYPSVDPRLFPVFVDNTSQSFHPTLGIRIFEQRAYDYPHTKLQVLHLLVSRLQCSQWQTLTLSSSMVCTLLAGIDNPHHRPLLALVNYVCY